MILINTLDEFMSIDTPHTYVNLNMLDDDDIATILTTQSRSLDKSVCLLNISIHNGVIPILKSNRMISKTLFVLPFNDYNVHRLNRTNINAVIVINDRTDFSNIRSYKNNTIGIIIDKYIEDTLLDLCKYCHECKKGLVLLDSVNIDKLKGSKYNTLYKKVIKNLH